MRTPLQTLFGKIFLWFFCAQVLIGTAMAAVGFAQREARTPAPLREWMGDELDRQLSFASTLVKSNRLEQFQFRRRRRDGGRDRNAGRDRDGGRDRDWDRRVTLFWFPKQGSNKVISRTQPVDASVVSLANRARDTRALAWEQSRTYWSGAKASFLGQGTLVIVNDVPRRSPPVFGFLDDWRTSEGQLRLLCALGLMGLVCYGLARHLTSPVARLSEATQKLTDGDLSARVGFPERGGDELIELGRDFDRMAARLEASTESERRLLGDISHELRSPLARLSVALDLVEQGQARAGERGEPVAESVYLGAIDRIRRESGRLNELIGQLLELTRLESLAQDAPNSPQAQNIALDEIVAEVVEDAEYEARTRSCDVELVSSERCSLSGVAPLLHSAIENVVRNAVRYTAEGTIVRVALKQVSESDQKPVAVVTVRDSGPGVPEESLQSLFRPFYRVADGRDRQSGGVGLGLAIAQRALKVHGGSIEARNVPAGGLEVEIRLPLWAKKAVAIAPEAPPASV